MKSLHSAAAPSRALVTHLSLVASDLIIPIFLHIIPDLS